MLGRAVGAGAVMFNNRARNGETFRLTVYMFMGVALINAVAFLADEKFGQMTMRPISVVMVMIVKMIMITGDKGVERLDAVCQPVAG